MNTTTDKKKTHDPIRLLVIDDNQAIHDDFRSVFMPEADTGELDGLANAILGKPPETPAEGNPARRLEVVVDSAYQGPQGLELLDKAMAEDKPYEVAFVDMRMPPGWDGLETIKRLWEVDRRLQVVICTAYSDYNWADIRCVLGESDSLLVLKKPFDAIEVVQMSQTLSNKWRAARQLDKQNVELMETVKQLYTQIKKREQVERELVRQVNHDELTALPNRFYITHRIERCIETAKRDPGYGYALCFLDLDQFKYINDSLGHSVGDSLLVEVGSRLTRVCRDQMQAHGEMLAGRTGGDEFVILFEDVTEQDYVEGRINRVRQEIAKPYSLNGHEVSVNSSIGIVMCDAQYDDAGLAMRDADTALYVSKENGRARHTFFDQSMHASMARRMRIENELRHALERGELTLNYQPIVNLENGQIVSFEALMRWNHPELGQVSPVEFLPVAEDCGLVIDLGYWALRESCAQYLRWVEGCSDDTDFTIHVNVSPRQFAISDFTQQVQQIMAETGVDPSRIGIEMTETAIVSDRGQVFRQVQELYDAGHSIAMDDFGTGHSSLGHLHEIPLNVVKIDRCFVKQIDPHGNYINTIKAIIEMSHNRGLRVVAEGIETYEQLVQLQAVECDRGQGYLFSPALTAEKAESLIRVPQLWKKHIEESFGSRASDLNDAA